MKHQPLSDQRMRRLRCSACGQRRLARVRRPFSYEITHDGRPATKIVIPDLEVIECVNPSCPADHPDHTVIHDDDALWRITTETYRQLGLLTPEEIRRERERLGLTQQQLQELLGLGGNSLSRWESGRVFQSRAMDTLLRIAFHVPRARAYLESMRLGLARPEPAGL